MASPSTDLSVFRGDDKTFNLAFVDSAGDAINLTGDTIFFTVKTNKTDTDANALISKDVTSHTDASGGLSAISLTNSDTDVTPGDYFYDIQKVTSGGVVTTIVDGKFSVLQDITLRDS